MARHAPIVERTAPLTNGSRVGGRFVLAGSTTKGCFDSVQGESNSLSIAFANRAVGRRPDLVQALFDKKRTTVGGRRDTSAVNTFRTPYYVLNTIAEEGDLVDENYKDCTSSFQLTTPDLQNRTPAL